MISLFSAVTIVKKKSLLTQWCGSHKFSDLSFSLRDQTSALLPRIRTNLSDPTNEAEGE